MSEAKHTAGMRATDLEVARAIHHNESLRAREHDDDFDVMSLFDDDEISVIDRMIDDNSRYAAAAKSEAERRGYQENINRLETERDGSIDAKVGGRS